MGYISSTVHRALGRLWRAGVDAGCESSVAAAAATQLAENFDYTERNISSRQWIAGDNLSVGGFSSVFLRQSGAAMFLILPSHDASCGSPGTAKEAGEAIDTAKLARQVEIATAHVIGTQVEAGVDVGNDGEQSRVGFQTYVPRCLCVAKRLPSWDQVDVPSYARQTELCFRPGGQRPAA
jgi:hypothetical protein